MHLLYMLSSLIMVASVTDIVLPQEMDIIDKAFAIAEEQFDDLESKLFREHNDKPGFKNGRVTASIVERGRNASFLELITYALVKEDKSINITLEIENEVLAKIQEKLGGESFSERERVRRRVTVGECPSGHEGTASECDRYGKYRTHSGRCNNLGQPNWLVFKLSIFH